MKKIEEFFHTATILILWLFYGFLAISSWGYPVFKTWTDVIDEEFAVMKTIIYIVVGMIIFGFSVGLHKVLEIIDNEKQDIEKEKKLISSWDKSIKKLFYNPLKPGESLVKIFIIATILIMTLFYIFLRIYYPSMD